MPSSPSSASLDYVRSLDPAARQHLRGSMAAASGLASAWATSSGAEAGRRAMAVSKHSLAAGGAGAGTLPGASRGGWAVPAAMANALAMSGAKSPPAAQRQRSAAVVYEQGSRPGARPGSRPGSGRRQKRARSRNRSKPPRGPRVDTSNLAAPGQTIVTPNRPAVGAGPDENMRWPPRRNGGPQSNGRHLAPAVDAGGASAADVGAPAPAAPAPADAAVVQCPRHCDCLRLPGHAGFCRFHGEREAAPAPKKTGAAAAAAAVAPPRPSAEAAAAAVEGTETSWQTQLDNWSAAQLEKREQAIVDRGVELALDATRRSAEQQSLVPKASARNSSEWAQRRTPVAQPAAGTKDKPPATAAKKLKRPASGRSWLAARRTAATNAGTAELTASPTRPKQQPKPKPKAKRTASSESWARLAAPSPAPAPAPAPVRPSTAGQAKRKERMLRAAAVAAAARGPALPLEAQLKQRIEEKYRRDKPDIPMPVWLLRALQRTRAEARKSHIIPAGSIQDIPGVLHIPSGMMGELVSRFGPAGDASPAAATIDYRKLTIALFPPLLGLHAPEEPEPAGVRAEHGEALAYLDFGATRTRVRTEVGGNRTRLTDVFRVAMDAFGGRRLNVKSLQFGLALLRIHVTAQAVRHFFEEHVSNGVVSGHGVASELLGSRTEKKQAARDDAGSPAVSSPDGDGEKSERPPSAADTAAATVASIVAKAKAKSSVRHNLHRKIESARQIESAKYEAEQQDMGSALLGKYRQLTSTAARAADAQASRSTGAAVGSSAGGGALVSSQAGRPSDGVAAKQKQKAVAGTEAGGSRVARGTVDLELAWANQASHRFSLAWSLKHSHKIVNPSMLEGISASTMRGIWDHRADKQQTARAAFIDGMLVQGPTLPPGTGILGGLETAASTPLAASERDGTVLQLGEVQAMISRASGAASKWAKKHCSASVSDRDLPGWEEPPDPVLPDFLTSDPPTLTPMSRQEVPKIGAAGLAAFNREAVKSQALRKHFPGMAAESSDQMDARPPDESSESDSDSDHDQDAQTQRKEGSIETGTGVGGAGLQNEPGPVDVAASPAEERRVGREQEPKAQHDAPPNRKPEGAGSRESSGASSGSSSNGGKASSGDGGESDEWEREMQAWEVQVSKSKLFGGYSSSDISTEELSPDLDSDLGDDDPPPPAPLTGEQPLLVADLDGAEDGDGIAASATEDAPASESSDEEELSEAQQKTFAAFNIRAANAAAAAPQPEASPPPSPPVTKRLARPASAPMRTKRWVSKDVTKHVNLLAPSNSENSDEEAAEDLEEDVLLGSMWLTQGANVATNAPELFGAEQHPSKMASIAKAGAAALEQQQVLWTELRETEQVAAAKPADAPVASRAPVRSHRRLVPSSPSADSLIELLQASGRIRAAIFDTLPWPVLRRCRQLSKQMALICCEAVAQRPQIAVLGGSSDCNPIAKVTAFDLPTATWRRLPDMDRARSNAAVCTMLDGKLLVAGGFDQEGVHASAEIFDPVCGKWTTLPEMSTARSGCRACPMLGSVNGAVVIGGYNADLVTVASVECFDADTGKWTELPPLTAPRYDFSACVLPRRGSERERLVVAGGTDDTSAWLKSAEVFNGKAWSLLPAMSMQRDRCGACVLPSGQVAVLGGSLTKGDSSEVKVHKLKTCETYDFATREWSDLPSMHASRCNFGTVTVSQLDGCVAVLGGDGEEGSRASTTAELYHPRTKKWTMLTGMSEPRSGCGAAVLSIAPWSSDIESELVEEDIVGRLRKGVERPAQDHPIRFYRTEEMARQALYGVSAVTAGACEAPDMLMGKKHFTGARCGTRGEGPAFLITATRVGGADLCFGNGVTASF